MLSSFARAAGARVVSSYECSCSGLYPMVFQKWTSSLAEGAQAVIHISVSHNNTILALQDPNGHKKAWSSAGTVGYKKSKRSSSMAAADAAASLVQKARDMGINTVEVKVKGVGSGREGALGALVQAGVNLVRITDTTPVPHNGCRPPRRRRI